MLVFALGFCVAHSILENLLHKSVNARRDANYALTIFGQRKVLELVGISRGGLGVRRAAAQTGSATSVQCASPMHVYEHVFK